MDIENGTDNDAKVRVTGGGPGQQPKDPKAKLPQEVVLKLGPKETLDLERTRTRKPLPPLPWTVHFSIEVEKKVESPAVTCVRLAKGNNGLKVEVVKNGNPRKAQLS